MSICSAFLSVVLAVSAIGISPGFAQSLGVVELQVTAAVEMAPVDSLIALTLQRGAVDKPGPLIGHVLQGGMTQGTTTITLKARDRTELMAGRLFLHLYSSAAPLGAGRSVLDVSQSGSSRQ